MKKCSRLFFDIIIINAVMGLVLSLDKRSDDLPSIPSFDELVSDYLAIGEMNNAYLSYDQFVSFTLNITTRFSSFLSLSSIGKSYEGNDIPLIQFKTNKEANKGILFNGMHHGREPVSMMMSIYILLKVISDYNQLIALFSNTNIYFIPIVNVDSYKYNCEQYNKNRNIISSYSRKNRNKNVTSQCENENIGVDINRNYDYFFGEDNIGSSNEKCNEEYRGPSPFSEPETIAMRDFLLSHKDIGISMNYHTFGNIIITPFNYASIKESNKQMKLKFALQNILYQEFSSEASFPEKISIGHWKQTIKYNANGDASDWMLGELGIVAFSHELGTKNISTDSFYPNKTDTFNILKENLPGAMYSIQKACYYLLLETIQSVYFNCKGRLNIPRIKCKEETDILVFHQLKISNTGLGKFKKEEHLHMKMILETNNVTIKNLVIKIGNGIENDLIYEQKAFNSMARKDEIDFELSIDLDPRKEAYLNLELISNGLVNITYNKDNGGKVTEWKYNKPSLSISSNQFALIEDTPSVQFNEIKRKFPIKTKPKTYRESSNIPIPSINMQK